MKDPSDNIRDWLYTLLYGNVSYGGSTVAVYSFPPKDQSFPYIVIGEQTMTGESESTKDAYITEHEVTIEIWDSYSGNDASYVKVNTIADSILQLVRVRTAITITGYNVIRLLADNMATERVLTEKEIIIYKSMLIRLLLEES
jgi:hypothetical protein